MKDVFLKITKEQGEFDFEVSAMLEELTQEEYEELKSMLITAIGTMEEMRRTERENAFTGYKWFARGKEIMSMEYPNEEEKDIEEIPFNNGMKEFIDTYHELELYNYKINELIKAVNELKKEGK